jgi:hypothetical protein
MDDFDFAYIHFDTACKIWMSQDKYETCTFNVHFIMLLPFSKTETYWNIMIHSKAWVIVQE